MSAPTNSSSPAASSSTEVLRLSPYTQFGPVFVGNNLNWMLMGTLIVQVYVYCTDKRRHKDPIAIRALVFLLLLLDTAQTITTTRSAWYYMVENWNNPPVLAKIPPRSDSLIPIFGGVIAALVQFFYAWRIWVLARNSVFRWISCSIISSVALMQLIASIVSTSLSLQGVNQLVLKRIISSIDIWLAGSFTTDVIIAGSMLWILFDARQQSGWGRTNSLLDKLIVNTIQTGVLTVVVAGVDLFLWIHYPKEDYHLTCAYILGKLYSNSFISNLNNRSSLSERSSRLNSTSGGSSGLGGTHVQTTNKFNNRAPRVGYTIGTDQDLTYQSSTTDWKVPDFVDKSPRRGDHQVELSVLTNAV